MYCGKCGVNYKKDKKVCPRCGTALQKGELKKNKASRIKSIIIIASATAVAVISLFLIIFFIGRVPPKLAGRWYEVNGAGYLEFKPNGVVAIITSGYTSEGTYAFNDSIGEGTLTSYGEESTLTCDGVTMYWGEAVMTKAVVALQDTGLNFKDIINQIK